MAENFNKTILKLQQLLVTKDLGEFLFENANQYLTILTDDNYSYEKSILLIYQQNN